jgi:hypothetical protein
VLNRVLCAVRRVQGPIVIRAVAEELKTSPHVRVLREFPGPLVSSASVGDVLAYLGRHDLHAEVSQALGVRDTMDDVMLLNTCMQVC